MAGIASHAYALFALTWAALCVLSSALVFDAMARDVGRADGR